MSERRPICTLDELPVGTIRALTVAGEKIVLVRTEEGVYALANECTHDGAPIADGKIRGRTIMCTRHGARFDLANGSVAAPPAIVPLDCYRVEIEGNQIFVLVN